MLRNSFDLYDHTTFQIISLKANKNRTIHLTLWVAILITFCGSSLRSQNSLEEFAAPKKIFIGNLISNAHLDDPENFRNGLADMHLREEYNAVVLENYMKMSFILPSSEPENIHNLTVETLRGLLTEDKIEDFLSNERWQSLRKRGHAMIWFNQAPEWLNLVGPTWTGQEVFSFTRKYILALGQICGNRVDEWDVINEAISDDSPNGQRIWREGTWYRRANDGSMTDWGEATYENYLKMLFVWAREAQPNARLHINDYGIEPFSTSLASKNRFMRDKVKALKDCGAPIDGVGFQSHFILSNMVSTTGEINSNYISSIEQSIQDLAISDIEVAITELDIRICNEDRAEAFQETAYQAFCEMALSQPNCHEIILWGLRDEDNWITLRNDGFFMGCQDASIVEGDDYSRKPAYNGVVTAISSLPDKEDFSFADLVQGSGSTADCGGEGNIIPDILQIQAPNAVFPGDQASVDVSYLATSNQDIVVWFQLDEAPFTVYAQEVIDVVEGSGTANTLIEIPMDVPAGTEEFRFLAFIVENGGGYDQRFNERFQNRVSVLDENSQLIISSVGPENVSPGDTAEVIVRYSAGENQEIVVWFQLDQSPFTTYQEFRQAASTGVNEIVAKVYIPDNVPLAEDAYQFQTLLVPTGGGWPERISNISQPNIDVVLSSSVEDVPNQGLKLSIFPNPTNEVSTLLIPQSKSQTEVILYNSIGSAIQSKIIASGVKETSLNLRSLSPGIYFVTVKQGTAYGMVKLFKNH